MNPNQPFFSVIMPVHNAEKYLENSIDSLLKQTFTDFELIIVNDGSVDLSKTICDEYAQSDSRIVLKETTEHIGVANVRNEGLKWIHGKYLTFVDADDYIDEDIFALAYAKIKVYEPDALKYGCIEEYYDYYDQVIGTKKVQLKERYLDDKKSIQKLIIDMEKLPLFGYVWNTFYSVDFLRQYKLEFNTELKVNEDFSYNLLFFDKAESLYCLDNCAYHYAKRSNNSLSTKNNDEYYKCHIFKIENLLACYKKWGLLDRRIAQKIFWLYTRCVYSAVCRTIAESGDYKATLEGIFTTKLYEEFTKVSTDGLTMKEKFLMDELKSRHMFFVYLLCLSMNFAKNNLKIIFAKIKG